MGTVNLTLPTSGTEITAGLHAANYAAIQAALNGDIDAANLEDGAITNAKINAAAAIAVSKLAAAGTNGHILTTVAGAPAWAAPSTTLLTHNSVATLDIGNTTTEQSIFAAANSSASTGYLLVGGTLGTTKIIRVKVWGDYLHNTGGSDTVQFSVVYGGTTVADGGAQTDATNNAARQGWMIEFCMTANGATNAQRATAWINVGGGGTGGRLLQTVSGSGTVDSTVDQRLDVRVDFGTASANHVLKRFGHDIVLIG